MFHEVILNVLRNPFIALFLTLSLGYLVGKIKYKTFVLGGISGSLIIGVIIGQLNITISPDIGSLFLHYSYMQLVIKEELNFLDH